MSCRHQLNVFKKRWKIVLTMLSVTVLYNEFFVYFLDSFKWPTIHCPSESCRRLMIVSDPQILGSSEPLRFIGYMDADIYLRKSFERALLHVEPDVILFLGDLMDEGSTSPDEDYILYKERFTYIFNTLELKPKVLYIPGDNDIGGEGSDHVSPAKVARFNSNFPSPVETPLWNVDFITVNRIVGDFIFPTVVSDAKTFRIVLSHIPLTFVPGIFSQEVMARLTPHAIFSAHDHRTAVATTHRDGSETGQFDGQNALFEHTPTIRKQLNSEETIEIVWPTCSYRMGVPKVGYGFATIDDNGEMVAGVLWIHSRFTSFWIYLIVIACCLIIYRRTKP